jgi:hypothetical protein
MLSKLQLAEMKELLQSGVPHSMIAIKYDIEKDEVRRLNKQLSQSSAASPQR